MAILATLKTHRTSLLFAILAVSTFVALAAAAMIAWPSLSYLADSLLH